MKKKKLLLIPLTLVCAISIGFFMMASPAPASGTELTDLDGLGEDASDPLQEYRERQQQLQQEMDSLKSQIKDQSIVIEGYRDEISDIEARMLVAQQQIDAIQVGIDSANQQISEAEIQIEEAEERLKERQAYLEKRLVDLYIYGDINVIDVIFETSSFEDFVSVFDMTEQIMQQDKNMLNGIAKERNTIINNKIQMETMRDELVEMTYEYEDLKMDLADLQAQKMTAMSAAISTQEGYQAMLDEFEAASNEVSEMIREYMKNNSDSTLSYGGTMIWPLPSPWGKNYVTSEYGNRYHPISGSYSFHTGIDIGADGGTSIYAAADGKIISRGWIGGYGNTIIIDHGNGISTLYAHQSAFGSFGVGDYVVSGDVIGYVGTTGNSTGNHLHFEVRVNGNHTSPWNYL